jgi:hypothetical protein
MQGREVRPGDILMVVHDFDARSSDELTLRRGDRINLVELDDGFGDGWYLGKHLASGGTGLFPAIYTTKLPAGIPNLRLNGSNCRASASSQAFVSRTSPSNQPSQTIRPTVFSSPRENPLTPSPSTEIASAPHSPTQPGNQSTAHTADLRWTAPVAAVSASTIPNIHRSINETIGNLRNGQESPVMNETLSVIDEHITDLSTPRQSLFPPELGEVNDSESEYSSHLGSRYSFTRGQGSVDESGYKLTESEVSRWTPSQVAEHLRRLGVDEKHCEIFEEQEITGDVLLEMDQHFVYMKEYDFGPMGRRLKTWHKIRDFQEEIKGASVSRQTTSIEAGSISTDSLGHSRSNISPTEQEGTLPHIPGLKDTPALITRHSRQSTDQGSMPTPLQTQSNANLSRTSTNQTASPTAWRATLGPDSPSRPSAASIREYSHSRRHSSMDAVSPGGFDPPGSTVGSLNISHKKQSSFDREWTMSSASARLDTTSSATTPYRLSTIVQETNDQPSEPPLLVDPSVVDLDRGYFSGGEVDSRKSRNVLRKRDSTNSSVLSGVLSMAEGPKSVTSAPMRHSRIASADSAPDLIPVVTSAAAKVYHSNSSKKRLRSLSARPPITRSPSSFGGSPTVTNLEDEGPLRSPMLARDSSGSSSPLPPVTTILGVSTKGLRIRGLRAISDAITGGEKNLVIPTSNPSSAKDGEVQSPARTRSSTPSVTSKSLEMDNTDTSSKGTDGPVARTSSRLSTRPRTKSKRETSAYTRGLQKLSPAEQRIGCDYSGWMKKKSSSLATTWKPRLFILRGRRLSYYYSEDDKEERGVIDISSHKVLVVSPDSITTLHATITGATSAARPTSIESSATLTMGDDASSARKSVSEAPFYFKLVPPKSGVPRAVQFTKPTVHYFQVDSLAEGRKWMGEMMKATIEHTAMEFQTTNKQKTISLAKARAQKERPPALKEAEAAAERKGEGAKEEGVNAEGAKEGSVKEENTKEESVKDGSTKEESVKHASGSKETGLNIRGLSFDDAKREAPSSPGHRKISSLDTNDKSGPMSWLSNLAMPEGRF